MKWLQSWVQELPPFDFILVARRHFMYRARAIDAGDLKRLTSIKRYALVVMLFHAQLHRATNDVLSIFVRKIGRNSFIVAAVSCSFKSLGIAYL